MKWLNEEWKHSFQSIFIFIFEEKKIAITLHETRIRDHSNAIAKATHTNTHSAKNVKILLGISH